MEPKVYKGIRGYITPPDRQHELPEDERVTPQEWSDFMSLCSMPFLSFLTDEESEDTDDDRD